VCECVCVCVCVCEREREREREGGRGGRTATGREGGRIGDIKNHLRTEHGDSCL
jgi:hypothetical protein